MTGNDLATMYEFGCFAIKRNLTNLTHEDSSFIPEPSGNCINWELGHIISARGMVPLLTGAGGPLFRDAEAAVFQRGSAAMKQGDQGVDLARLNLPRTSPRRSSHPHCRPEATGLSRRRCPRSSSGPRSPAPWAMH